MSDQKSGGATGATPKGATPDVAAAQAKYPFHKRFVRKAIEIRIEVERFSEAIASSSVNISPSGICFKINQPLEQNERMKVLLYVPRGKEVEILKVQARMVWQEAEEGEMWRVGAAYEQYAPGDERRLRAWLLELA